MPYPTREQLQLAMMPMIGPDGPFTIAENEKGRFFPKAHKSMIHFFVSAFEKYQNETFIVYKDERHTFKETWDISRDIGVLLKKKFGIKEGERVAIAMRNFPEWCFCFIGIGSIGAVNVPVNSFWTGQEMLYGLSDSGSKVLFCDFAKYKEIEPFLDNLNNIHIIVTRAPKNQKLKSAIRYEDFIHEINPNERLNHSDLLQIGNQIQPDDSAIIMYTSGSTGKPKGVVLTHRGVLTQMEVLALNTAVRKRVSEMFPDIINLDSIHQPCVLCVVPLFHGTGSHHNFLSSLVIGRKLVLLYKWDPELALQIIEKEKVTNWSGVPTMVADVISHPSFNKYNTTSLLNVGSGGAPTPKSQVLKTNKAFINGCAATAYGLTETNGGICVNFGDDYEKRPTSCGFPFPVVEVKIVDLETNETLPPNQPGEIWIRSNLNMREYWNKPSATAKVLTDDGYFKSGDIATIDEEGFIYIVDRAKDIIIRGGENISCTEVENAIYTHPNVRECAVFGLQHERLGEVVGVLILLESPTTSDDIVQFLKGKLAPFKIPEASNIFFTDKPLPRGATGKIQKQAIKAKYNQAKLPSKL